MKDAHCHQIEQLFSAKLDGVISAGEEQELLDHLNQCHSCASKYELDGKIAQALQQQPRITCPNPDFSQQVMQAIGNKQQSRGVVAGRIGAWKKAMAAAAAAAVIMAGSWGLNGFWQGGQVAQQGTNNEINNKGTAQKMVANNQGQGLSGEAGGQKDKATGVPNVVPEDNPNVGAITDNQPRAPEQKTPGSDVKTNKGADRQTTDAGAKGQANQGKHTDQQQEPGTKSNAQAVAPVVLLSSSELVAKSTTLKLAVADVGAAEARVEALAAGAGGQAQVLANQSNSQGAVQIVRITVGEQKSQQLINGLGGIGTTMDRQQDTRNMTSQYNKLAARYNELANQGDAPGVKAERASIKQQMDILQQDAQSHAVVLWLQQQ